jgi:hypothetical protein
VGGRWQVGSGSNGCNGRDGGTCFFGFFFWFFFFFFFFWDRPLSHAQGQGLGLGLGLGQELETKNWTGLGWAGWDSKHRRDKPQRAPGLDWLSKVRTGRGTNELGFWDVCGF